MGVGYHHVFQCAMELRCTIQDYNTFSQRVVYLRLDSSDVELVCCLHSFSSLPRLSLATLSTFAPKVSPFQEFPCPTKQDVLQDLIMIAVGQALDL